MTGDGRNCHGDSAISLEDNARLYFWNIGHPVAKNYDADSLEVCNFIVVMILLLREQKGFDSKHHAINEFVKACVPYLEKSGSSIESEAANRLYDWPTELFN